MRESVTSVPINVVGSSTFGLHPKIGLEKTYNMFISDKWLINYAGYECITGNLGGDEGRGLFHSIRGDFLIAVIDNRVYQVNSGLGAQQVGLLKTRTGEVFIDENLTSQICIVDGNNAWIYNYEDFSFTLQALDVGFEVVPGYVTYHNSFFLIAPSENDPNSTSTWYAFQRETDSTIALVPDSVFPLQSKPDKCIAVKRLPGRSNHVLVIGTSVCEVYTQVGGRQNYRRNSSFNIDSGTVAASTIAENDQFLCFLAQNEKNSPTILYTNGSETHHISTDGIDDLLQDIVRPDLSTAFFYRQDGHLFYQLTFFGADDNLSLLYDFSTQKFFNVTDDDMNFHPARQIVYFNKQTLFVGLEFGNLYHLSTDIPDARFQRNNMLPERRSIPRIRITNTVRLPDSRPFFCKLFTFWISQGLSDFSILQENVNCVGAMVTEGIGGKVMVTETGEIMVVEGGNCTDDIIERPRVDLTFSKTGNQTFSNGVGRELNPEGVYRNQMQWYRLGFANEITFQLRFWGLNRFVVNNGVLEITA